jgi:hypothetical protein
MAVVADSWATRVALAMTTNPADRYQTAREMHAALGRGKLVPRAWQRIAPHDGHDRCWVERARLAGGRHASKRASSPPVMAGST